MEKSEFYVDLILKEPMCSMISPRYEYPRTKDGLPVIGAKKIPRNPDNLKKLETMVSTVMQANYQKVLAENLEKTVPILYIDCNKRGTDDIMFFIFKEYIKQSKAKNKYDIVNQEIGSRTIVTQERMLRRQYIDHTHPSMEELLDHYSTMLLKSIEPDNPGQKKMMLDFEMDIALHGLGELMEDEEKKYLYLYLDNVQSLDIAEQQRINTFLYTRGHIPRDRWIRVKVNNGQDSWKTRYSSIGHRVESTHDYSEVTIHEDQLV